MAALANPKPGAGARVAPPFSIRFRAWWEGVDQADLVVPQAAPAVATPVKKSAVSGAAPELPWNTPRVKMLQVLWGPGFSRPGGRDFALWLANPCTLDPSLTVVELGAGLGGLSRTIESELGCWITGLERDPELATAGMELSTLAGVGKKAQIQRYDPENFDLKPAGYDCILSCESIFAVENRKAFFDQIGRALKVNGHLAYIDIVRIPKDGDVGPTYRAWVEGEPYHGTPWTLTEHRQACADRALDLRVADDITALLRGQVLHAMADLLQKAAELRAASPEGKAALDTEIALWTRRIAAIDAGEIGVCRFHAIKISTKTMSNW
jgi:SAM-dependent methyltransferase